MIQQKTAHLLSGILLLVKLSGLAQPVSLPHSKHKFIVIAHRGDHTNAPENTLAAFQHAIDAGADFVEIDLRTTKDSQLIIMHDASIDRMTGYKGNVKDLDLDSLHKINIRDALHPEWGFQHIPTFKEVLQLCKGKINVYLDFKNASVNDAYKEITAAGMKKSIVVYINSPQQLIDWRTIAPQMPLMISLPRHIISKEQMANLLDSVKVDVLDGNYDEYNTETVAAAKEKRIPIWADIQSADEAEKWDKALLLGLQGLQTDHPKALIEYLKKKGKR